MKRTSCVGEEGGHVGIDSGFIGIGKRIDDSVLKASRVMELVMRINKVVDEQSESCKQECWQ